MIKNIDDGIEILDALAGTALITIDPIDTSGLPDSKRGLLWDIQVVDYTNQKFTVLDGILSVFADVTQG